ncbi:MAG: FtsX-like permease family protein [Bacteroidaceae bacterium]|nr:FtsX-like permease family protein [Bacteroidaceae bacterium]
MFRHYITIALRNIRKYALQNTVSMIGLTVGFVCLTLSTVWIRYENSFDTFHKDADRLYYIDEINEVDGSDQTKYNALGVIIYDDFDILVDCPEVESLCKYVIKERKRVTTLMGDTAFFKMFDFHIASGTDRFKTDSSYVAVTQDFAHKVYGYDNPIGKKCNGKTVCAVIAPFKHPSLFRFDVLMWHDFQIVREANYHSVQPEDRENNVIIKLHKGIDSKEFSDKLTQTIKAESWGRNPYRHELRPLQEFHRHIMKNGMYIKYIHSGLFVTACLLLLVCAIVNYMLFSLNRLRNRAREMALRMVHGASNLSITALMLTEYALVLGTSLILGLISVLFFLKPFREMTDIQMTGEYVFGWSLLLMLLLFLISVAVCIVSTFVVRRRSMQISISRKSSRLFRNLSIGIQIFISVLFVFAVSAMIYQFRFLRNNDWGVKINDTAVLSISNSANQWGDRFDGGPVWNPPKDENEVERRSYGTLSNNELASDYISRLDGLYGLNNSLASIPAVQKIYFGIGDIRNIFEAGENIFHGHGGSSINGIEDCDAIILDVLDGDALELMSLNVLDGAIPDRRLGNDEIAITRSLQKELGLGNIAEEPTLTIDRKFTNPGRGYIDDKGNLVITSGGETGRKEYTFRVIAIVSDIYPFNFNTEPGKFILCAPGNRRLMPRAGSGWSQALYTLTYEHGMKDELKQQIERIMSETGLYYKLDFTEDRFFADLESEQNLAKLIEILGLVCLLISVSGIFSIITLSCQERRREIAVRKVHGAKVKDILSIFTKEYGVVFVVSSAAAFIVGYLAIRHWQQQFLRQTTVSWWIYAAILVAMALVICLTVGQRVLKATRENPADVIKSE